MSEHTPTNWETLQGIASRLKDGERLLLTGNGTWIDAHVVPSFIDPNKIDLHKDRSFVKASFMQIGWEDFER